MHLVSHIFLETRYIFRKLKLRHIVQISYDTEHSALSFQLMAQKLKLKEYYVLFSRFSSLVLCFGSLSTGP